MRLHSPERRYTLLAALLCARRIEVTDQVVQFFTGLIRRIETRADRALEKEMVANLPKVVGKQ